jgi:hypothetical protein
MSVGSAPRLAPVLLRVLFARGVRGGGGEPRRRAGGLPARPLRPARRREARRRLSRNAACALEIWFQRSAHNVPFEEPERFNAAALAALQSVGIGADTSEKPR